MRKIINKADEEFIILQEFWKLLQDFFEPESTDDYWDKFLEATAQFDRAHPDNLLCEQLILMTMSYLEKKYKNDRTVSYAKLFTTVKWAYKDFMRVASDEEKRLLDEILTNDNCSKEQQIMMKVRELQKQEEMERLSNFLEG